MHGSSDQMYIDPRLLVVNTLFGDTDAGSKEPAHFAQWSGSNSALEPDHRGNSEVPAQVASSEGIEDSQDDKCKECLRRGIRCRKAKRVRECQPCSHGGRWCSRDGEEFTPRLLPTAVPRGLMDHAGSGPGSASVDVPRQPPSHSDIAVLFPARAPAGADTTTPSDNLVQLDNMTSMLPTTGFEQFRARLADPSSRVQQNTQRAAGQSQVASDRTSQPRLAPSQPKPSSRRTRVSVGGKAVRRCSACYEMNRKCDKGLPGWPCRTCMGRKEDKSSCSDYNPELQLQPSLPVLATKPSTSRGSQGRHSSATNGLTVTHSVVYCHLDGLAQSEMRGLQVSHQNHDVLEVAGSSLGAQAFWNVAAECHENAPTALVEHADSRTQDMFGTRTDHRSGGSPSDSQDAPALMTRNTADPSDHTYSAS